VPSCVRFSVCVRALLCMVRRPKGGESRLQNHQVIKSDQKTAHSVFEQWTGLTPLQAPS
jgi:hypothetical protein